ncbi:MAG: hypothetical protein RIQ70_72 [Bacteroidota bacterium]|jgi:Zn-dependent oligopeptidase
MIRKLSIRHISFTFIITLFHELGHQIEVKK